MKRGFEIGDIVALKSGGPRMTIDAIEEVNGAGRAACFWFADSLAQKAVFALTSLQPAEEVQAEPKAWLVG